MDQIVLMRILQSVCRLDRNIQDPLLHLFFASFVQRSVFHAVTKAAVFHPFRKNCRNAADFTDIVAGYNVGVQTEVDPVVALFDKLFFRSVAALGKESGMRPLHGQIRVPAVVMYAPYTSHAAGNRIGRNLVCVENGVSVPNHLI